MEELRLYAEDNREGMKIFIQGNDMAEYTFQKGLAKRNVKTVWENVKIENKETNQKDLANPQDRR